MAGLQFQLEDLPHQDEAINAIMANFAGIDEYTSDADANYQFANPILQHRGEDKFNIDIKMETGTGKTFVYTRMMYELHRKYSLFKFIIVVPTPAIKEGTKSFIESDYANQYFKHRYNGVEIDLQTINAGDFSNNKAGRQNLPAKLQEYLEATRQDSRTIQVLLVNAGMLSARANMMNPSRHYDSTLIGGFDNPRAAIALTRPVVIIDEPHRFVRDKTDYGQIMKLQPQRIIRFGATFPIQKYVRSGKVVKNPKDMADVTVVRDYYRGEPQYNLNAVESFNQDLVKGIDVDYPVLDQTSSRDMYTISKLTARDMTLQSGGNSWTLGLADELSDINASFGANLRFNGKSREDGQYHLSNGQVIAEHTKLIPGIYSQSYQEVMLEAAINSHLVKEKNNFLRQNRREDNLPRVKTLSLFFIDDIKGYRNENGWLRMKFEEILRRQLKAQLDQFSLATKPRELEYKEFLQASLANISATHGGYFSEDNSNSDEVVQSEVNDILRNKQHLLQFQDEQGNWILRRFLFSKWTLREGWDNPNVFVIAKLRSSGSENSKIQEVGRGLRLPVDETGHRLQIDELDARLDYIVSADEENFAKLLTGEVNNDTTYVLDHNRLTPDMVKAIVKYQQKYNSAYTETTLRNELGNKGIIDFGGNFQKNVTIDGQTKDGFDWFKELHNEVVNTVNKGKIRDNHHDPQTSVVKLNIKNWDKLKGVWRKISRRYMLEFKPLGSTIESILQGAMADPDGKIFVKGQRYINRASLGVVDNVAEVRSSNKYFSNDLPVPSMPYGRFLKQLVDRTNLPVSITHKYLYNTIYHKLGDTTYLSDLTLNNLVRDINRRLKSVVGQLYHYRQLDYSAQTSVWDDDNDCFYDEVNANLIGRFDSNANIDYSHYLYDEPVRYDSRNPELDIINSSERPEIVTFGKLPREAIRVPRYNGSTSTPDLIYMIKTKQGNELYLLVEAKATPEQQRQSDMTTVRDERQFFNDIDERNISFIEANSVSDVVNELNKMIKEGDNND